VRRVYLRFYNLKGLFHVSKIPYFCNTTLVALAISFSVFGADSTVLGSDLFDQGKKLNIDEIRALIVNDV
jgi:hypothetical protein